MEWMTTRREESGLLCCCFVSLSGPMIIIIIIITDLSMFERVSAVMVHPGTLPIYHFATT